MEDKNDEIKIQYKIKENAEDNDTKKIRIFGDKFVENNQDKCKIIIDEKEIDLCTHLDIDSRKINNDIFEIKLKGINKIIDLSYIFSGEYDDSCQVLSLPDIWKWDTQKILQI